jgi:hypothetical protein
VRPTTPKSNRTTTTITSRRIVERLTILPKAHEKNAFLSVLAPATPQALLTDPQLMKLIALSLMKYQETTTHTVASLSSQDADLQRRSVSYPDYNYTQNHTF